MTRRKQPGPRKPPAKAKPPLKPRIELTPVHDPDGLADLYLAILEAGERTRQRKLKESKKEVA